MKVEVKVKPGHPNKTWKIVLDDLTDGKKESLYHLLRNGAENGTTLEKEVAQAIMHKIGRTFD